MTESKIKRAALFLGIAALATMAAFSINLRAQTPPPSSYSNVTAVASAIAASGAASAVRNVNVDKTYQVVGATASGAGSAVVQIQGSNNSTNWDGIGTVTLTLSAVTSSGSFSSTDRYLWVRPFASTLTGSTPTYSVLMGY